MTIAFLRFQVLKAARMKITAFWDILQCNFILVRISEVRTASNTGVILDAALKRRSTSSRLHGAISQKVGFADT
jgi:hypothetical protein